MTIAQGHFLVWRYAWYPKSPVVKLRAGDMHRSNARCTKCSAIFQKPHNHWMRAVIPCCPRCKYLGSPKYLPCQKIVYKTGRGELQNAAGLEAA